MMKSLFLSITFLVIVVVSKAQTLSEEPSKYSFNYTKIVPGMPENASLGSYGNTPVDLAKGVPNISFNLYSVSSGGVTVPISISYAANGIKFDDIPSAVGLKWSLNAGGSVTRSVNGLADEDYLLNNLNRIDPDYIYYQNLHVNSHPTQDSSKLVAKNSIDVSLDYYYYDFPGHSGSMYLSKHAEFIPDKEFSKIKITYTNHLDTFEIKDDLGNDYLFTAYADQSTVYSSGKYNKQALHTFGARVSWKLKKITTTTKQEINFEYVPYYYSYNMLNSERWTVYTTPPGGVYCPCGGFDYYIGYNDDSYQTTQFTNTAWLLSKISSNDQDVLFNYYEDTTLSLFKKKLSSIKVYSKLAGDTIKRFGFTYDGQYLLGYTEMGKNMSDTGKRYSFGYNGRSIFPDPYSKNRDMYGYSNGSSNSSLIANPAVLNNGYSWSLADRSINEYAQAGVLNQITYPTGGKTHFEFEGNIDTAFGTIYAPGIRVKTIWDEDQWGNVSNKKNFYYRGLRGGLGFASLAYNNEDAFALEPTMIGVYYSDSQEPGNREEFFYSTVITENIGRNGSSEIQYEKDSFMHQSSIYDRFGGLLVKKELYKTDTFHLLRKEDYIYSSLSIDSAATSTFKLRKAVPFLGNYSYEGDPAVYPLCPATTIYQGFDQQHVSYPILYILDTVRTTEFDGSGKSMVSTTINNYYSNPVVLQKTSTINSNGDVKATKYYYPFQKTGRFSVENFMWRNNVISMPIKEQYLVNDSTRIEKESFYTVTTEGAFVLDRQEIRNTAPKDTQTLYYYHYNTKVLPTEVGKKNDFKTAYLYDYLDLLPVAEVKNSDLASIAYTSFETDSTGKWSGINSSYVQSIGGITGNRYYNQSSFSLSKSGLNSSVSYIVSYWSKNGAYSVSGTVSGWPKNLHTINVNGQIWAYYEHKVSGVTTTVVTGTGSIDELRLYPSNAQMTTYTYNPSIGVSSVCDLNNRISFYIYDGMGRLMLVLDDNRNILKKFCYNYAGQNENCQYFGNVQKSGGFVRSNCAAGGNGGIVVYTIPANTYFSTVSQDDADQKAQNDVNTNGQTYANNNGYCTWYNTIRSGFFTRNNCGTGYVGSTVTYTVYAGTYSSTISQEDADQKAINDINTNGQNYANTYGTCTVVCTNCSAVNQKCINGVCERGIKVYTSSTQIDIKQYQCTYHYEWSDGSWSPDYTETRTTACLTAG